MTVIFGTGRDVDITAVHNNLAGDEKTGGGCEREGDVLAPGGSKMVGGMLLPHQKA